MKIKITRSDYIWSYIGYFFSLFTNVLILPFVMKLVPSQELGLWYTFLSVGMIANIFDNTFTLSVSRNITYAWSGITQIQAEGFDSTAMTGKGPNYRLLVSIVQTCRAIFATVSLLALALMLTGGSAYIGFTARSIDLNIWTVSWVIYSAGVFLNLFYSYWLTALRGVGAIKESQKSLVAARVAQIVLSLVGLFLGYGIIALSVSYFASGLILRILARRYFMKYENIHTAYKKYKSQITRSEIGDNFKKIWFNAKKNGLNAIATFCITQSTTLICSAYLGLAETASYGLCLQIITAVAGVAMIYFNTEKPKMTELKIGGEATRGEFVKSVSLSVTMYWLTYVLEMIVLVIAGLPLLGLLKAETNIPLAMVLFMGLYLFLENNHSVFAGIIEMSNTVPYLKASLISAVCVVAGEFFVGACTGLGIYGLMCVQFLVQLVYNNWKWPLWIFREYHLNPASILKMGCTEGIGIVKSRLHKPAV